MNVTVPTRLLGTLTAVAAAAATTPSAHAGSYDVQVCRGGYGNGGALTSVRPGPAIDWMFRTTQNCDGNAGGWNGISMSVENGPANPNTDPWVPVGTSAFLYVKAPDNTGITGINVDGGRLGSFLGGNTGWHARVMVPSASWCTTDGLGGSPCAYGIHRASSSPIVTWADGSYPTYSGWIGPVGGAAADLAIGVVCGGGAVSGGDKGGSDGRPCYRWQYASSAGASIGSAQIRMFDAAKPQIAPLTGSVVQGGWRKPGDVGFHTTGWDNTGIRAFERWVDGQYLPPLHQSCDYSRLRPCEDRIVDSSVPVGGDWDGTHTVMIRALAATTYDLNCAYDCAEATAQVQTDGTAPGASTVSNPGPAWSKTKTFNLRVPLPSSENDPDGAGPQGQSPITRAIATVCPEGFPANAPDCKSSDLQHAAAQGSAPVVVPKEGAWAVRVQLVDAAGNVGAVSAPAAVRYDATAPTAAAEQIDGGGKISVRDAVSAPAGLSYRVDGKGEWVSPTDAVRGEQGRLWSVNVDLPAGQHFVDVRAVDNAGNEMTEQRFYLTMPDDSRSSVDPVIFGDANSQLLVVDRGAPNGIGASEQATVSAWFVSRAKSKKSKKSSAAKKDLTVRTMGTRSTATIQGTLVSSAGAGIGGARIDMASAIAGGRTEIDRGVAVTDGAGNFAIKLKKGQTSRKLTIAYMSHLNDVQPAGLTGLQLNVKARATFKVSNTRAGHNVRFSGRVSSRYLTKAGVRVLIQWRNPKTRRWDTFDDARTDSRGRWVLRKLLTQPTSYRMRAYVPSSPAYAYKGAVSRAKTIRIR